MIRKTGLTRLAIVAICGVATLWAVAALALSFPSLSGRVVDEAGLLTAQDQANLAAALQALEGKTTDQLVVVTLTSLQGTSIEDYGYQLGRHWGIGQSGKDNGVLLIVAPSERAVRIEVGYGLEGTLTDAISRVIIDTAILPRFRDGDFPGGILAGAGAIIEVLAGDVGEWQQRAADSGKASAQALPAIYAVPLTFALLLLVLFAFAGMMRNLFFPYRQPQPSAGAGYIDPWPTGPRRSGSGRGSSSGAGSSGGGFSGGGGSFGGGGSSGRW